MATHRSRTFDRRPSSIVPRLALIADAFTDERVAARAVDAARAGAPWVHLRDHAASEAAFEKAARALAERLRTAAPGALLLSVNSRPRVAEELSAGLHTGRHGPSANEARRQRDLKMLVGRSVHDRAEAARGAADYFFFSPVFPTASKPGHPGTGLDALQRFCKAFPDTPTLALGGLTPQRVRSCLDAGAHGVAVLSGILHADDPTHATRQYLNAFPDQ